MSSEKSTDSGTQKTSKTSKTSKTGSTSKHSSQATTKTTTDGTDGSYAYTDPYGSSGLKSQTQQDVQLEEINTPPVYKRIACIRYVRPMMCDGGWGAMGGPYCGNGYPYGYGYDPYYSGYPGECQTTRALIIPPRPKNPYRPARDEDLINIKSIDECASFLKINGVCEPHVIEEPKPKVHVPKPKTPPPPPPPKPKPDRTKILHKFLKDAKREKKKSTQPSTEKKPPSKKEHHVHPHHHHLNVEHHPHPHPPPKKEHPHTPPKHEHHPPVPPKKEKSPPHSPPKQEKPPPPPKPPTPPPSPPKPIVKPPPPVIPPKRPSPPPKKKSDSSVSSVKSAMDNFHFGEKLEHGRDQHFQTDVTRRGSSFDAINNAAVQIRNDTRTEAIAPQRRH